MLLSSFHSCHQLPSAGSAATCPHRQAPHLLAPKRRSPRGLQSLGEVRSCQLICPTVPKPAHCRAATAKLNKSLVLFPFQWSIGLVPGLFA